MKKLGVLCLILGLILLLVGIGGRYFVENHEKIKELNAYLTVLGQKELTPEFVQKLLDGKVDVLGQTVTMEDIVREYIPEDADTVMAGCWVYAHTPIITKIGAVLAGIGLLLSIFAPGKKKKAGYASYA